MRGKTNQSHHFFLTIQHILSSIGPNSDQTTAKPLHGPEKKRLFAQKSPLLGLLFLAPLGACEPPAVSNSPPPQQAEANCGEHGALETSLFGGIETNIKWSGSTMVCDNMQRPDGQGIRLRFAGDISGERLAFIIALPELEPGEDAAESPSNVTATVEGSGRFFSTPDLNSCWTNVDSQAEGSGDDSVYTIRGALFCIAPLGEVNGDAAVSIHNLTFTTIVNWNDK
jgi:hypothetical protein